MAQESRLAVTIDSRGAKRNADDLTGSLEQMTKAGESAAGAAEKVSTSLDEQRNELSKLLGQINPTVAALGRLDDMQAKLEKFKKAGIVESDTFVEYTNRINTMRESVNKVPEVFEKTSQAMARTGMSSAQMSNNLRMLPAQFTDIAVSLQGGQAPLTVLLQQGGQLKDMFGGIGPAARAMGGYILGLVNPFSVAAAAAAALGLAYYKGAAESEAFGKALIISGNAANTSVDELSSAAEKASGFGVTVGAAADALEKLAASGNPVTIMYAGMAAAAVKWSTATGQSIDEVVANFSKIAKDPVNAVRELDKQLNFLTATQYEEITALQARGDAQQAAIVAEQSYANAISQRADQIKQNLGGLETAWNSITGAAKRAWDSMLDIGRQASPEQQLEAAYKALAKLNKQGENSIVGNSADFKAQLQKAGEEITRLQLVIANTGSDALDAAFKKSTENAAKVALDSLSAGARAAMPEIERLGKQLEDLDKQRAAAIAGGVYGEQQQADYAKARAGYEKQIAEIRERDAKRNAPKAVKQDNRGVSEAESTFARLYAQYDPAAQAARNLTKEQTQLQLALDKGKISQEEYGKGLAQASINYAAAIKGAQGLTAVEQYRAQLQKQLANEQAQYDLDTASVGMGDLQASRMQQRLNLEMQTNDRLLQLQTELASATDAKQRQALQGQIDAVNEFLPQQLAAMQAGWAQMDQAMLNPINGWTAAVQNFGVQAMDIAGQTQSIFSSAFNTISTDITSAIMDGTLSLSTLGDIGAAVLQEVIAGFVRMGVQMAMNAALSATLGTAVAGQSMILAGTTATAWAPAAALASLATLGGNSIPAAAALTSTTALATSLAVIPGFSTGGMFNGAGTGTSDSNLAWLSDGEFIVNAKATKNNRALLEAINSGERVSTGGGSGSVSVAQGGGVVVNLNEDASKAGQVRSRQEGGQNFIDIWVSSIMGDGAAHNAMQAKYGLQGQGS